MRETTPSHSHLEKLDDARNQRLPRDGRRGSSDGRRRRGGLCVQQLVDKRPDGSCVRPRVRRVARPGDAGRDGAKQPQQALERGLPLLEVDAGGGLGGERAALLGGRDEVLDGRNLVQPEDEIEPR